MSQKFLLLIQKNQFELQRRILLWVSENSKETEKIATAVAFISLILSFAAIWFAYTSSIADDNRII